MGGYGKTLGGLISRRKFDMGDGNARCFYYVCQVEVYLIA